MKLQTTPKFTLHAPKQGTNQRAIDISPVVPAGYKLVFDSVKWGSPPHADQLAVVQPQIDGTVRVITSGLHEYGSFELNFYAAAEHPNAGTVALKSSCIIEVMQADTPEIDVELQVSEESDLNLKG